MRRKSIMHAHILNKSIRSPQNKNITDNTALYRYPWIQKEWHTNKLSDIKHLQSTFQSSSVLHLVLLQQPDRCQKIQNPKYSSNLLSTLPKNNRNWTKSWQLSTQDLAKRSSPLSPPSSGSVAHRSPHEAARRNSTKSCKSLLGPSLHLWGLY